MSQKFSIRMKRSAKIGTYSFVMGVVVLAAVIVANLLLGALPARLTVFDTSDLAVTDVSEESLKFVGGIEEDVTIYWLCQNGTIDDQMNLFLTRYVEAGDHITLKVVDPYVDVTFTSAYTEEKLSNYSFIIESARRFQVIDAMDMAFYTSQFVTEYLYSGQVVPLTYEEYSQIYQYYGSYMTDDVVEQYFNGEAIITSALDYVTKEHIPHAYLLTGHGDVKPSEQLSELLSAMNVTVEEINLQTEETVPADANCLILFAPKGDISAHETTLIKGYLEQGGSLVMATSPENVAACPNVMSLGAMFGVTAEEGVVAEGDTGCMVGNVPTKIIPTVSKDNYATSYVSGSGYKAQVVRAHSLAVAATLPAGVTVTPLFTTSATATRVSLADDTQSLDTAGVHNLAVAATKSYTATDGTAYTAELTWYASTETFTDTMAEATSGGNYYYLAASVSATSEAFSSVFEALSPVNLSGHLLTGVVNDTGTGYAAGVFVVGIVTAVVIPVGLLAAGVIIWVLRKRR